MAKKVELTREQLLAKWKKNQPEFMASLSESEIEDMYRRYDMCAFWPVEYVVFDFRNKTDEECNEYLTNDVVKNTLLREEGKEETKILRRKFACYRKLKPYYKRAVVRSSNESAFRRFCKKHKQFICKPGRGTGGKGILFGDLAKEGLTADQFREKYLSEGSWTIEELIDQDYEMAKFHPESINTVRITTVRKGDQVTVLFALLRLGRGSNKVDNTSQGGLAADIDTDTGMITSGALDHNTGEKFAEHPDTHIALQGQAVPNWDELVATVKSAALEMDQAFIGWDMALSTKGWVIVEANWRPSVRTTQLLKGEGIRRKAEEATGWKFYL